MCNRDVSMNGYGKRISGEIVDPSALHHWHDEAAEVLCRGYSDALSSGEHIPILVSSLLMRLRLATPDEVRSADVNTIGVSTDTLYVNGMAIAGPHGTLRGNTRAANAIAMHDAHHLMRFHNIRVAELFQKLREQGLIDAPGRIDASSAWKIANLVLDVVPDSFGEAGTAELSDYTQALLEDHTHRCRKILVDIIQTHCDESITPDWLAFVTQGQTITVIHALQLIIRAVANDIGNLDRSLEDVEYHFLPPEEDSIDGIRHARKRQIAIVSGTALAIGKRTELSRQCIDAESYLVAHAIELTAPEDGRRGP